MPIDVIVTVIGSEANARAIRRGGGLVGMRSSATPPGGPVAFVDWPYQLADPSVEEHVTVVREQRPRYAVAPDVEGDWTLPDVVDVADELAAYAETVIVVPKAAAPGRVPDRFRLGVPFRQGFETPIGANAFPAYRGHGPVHVLGGNPNEQLRLREEFGFDVGSVDTPLILAWADFGRVFVAAGGGGVEAETLGIEPRDPSSAAHRTLDLGGSRADRVEFSVRNLVQAWTDREIVVVLRSLRGEQTRGMPPVLPPIDLVGAEEIAEAEALYGKPYEEIRAEREAFDVEMEVTEEFGDIGGQERIQYDLFDPPDAWAAERATSGPRERGPMDDKKREWFQFLQRESDEAVEDLGLGRGALPERDEDGRE